MIAVDAILQLSGMVCNLYNMLISSQMGDAFACIEAMPAWSYYMYLRFFSVLVCTLVGVSLIRFDQPDPFHGISTVWTLS